MKPVVNAMINACRQDTKYTTSHSGWDDADPLGPQYRFTHFTDWAWGSKWKFEERRVRCTDSPTLVCFT